MRKAILVFLAMFVFATQAFGDFRQAGTPRAGHADLNSVQIPKVYAASRTGMEIVDGKVFSASALTTLTLGQTLIISIATPSTGTIHLMSYQVFTDGGWAEIELLENCGLASGAVTTPVNRLRSSAYTFGGTVLKDATVTTGTVIEESYIGGAAIVTTPLVGDLDTDLDWILSVSTRYAIRVTNRTSATAHVGLNVVWSWE